MLQKRLAVLQDIDKRGDIINKQKQSHVTKFFTLPEWNHEEDKMEFVRCKIDELHSTNIDKLKPHVSMDTATSTYCLHAMCMSSGVPEFLMNVSVRSRWCCVKIKMQLVF